MSVDIKHRQIFPPRILPPQIASGANIICGVVWCGFRVSTDRLVQIEKIEYIHLMERLQKKESKKGNAANLHQVSSAGCFVIGGKEFSKISKCEHVIY